MNNPFDFGAISKAMKDLQDAYAGGLGAMEEASQQTAEEMNPSHRIIVDTKLSANVESHDYKVDTHIEFIADLNSILENQAGDITSLLSGLNEELSEEEKAQVAEQLGKPKCIAIVDKINTKELELHSEEGSENTELNKEGTMLISLEGEKLTFSFESILSFPKLTSQKTVYFTIPSMQKMQENITLPLNKLDQKTTFSWQEKDKDNLKIKGTLQLKPFK